ncbi:hypothetical protein G195_000116 [Phytophthora kernoviae 00238/432]|uniref:ABC transmembrane type-1 domain-containing protein n=1 Tax=Phytophthora kernoviae 00238/432 TaxID=1284355 RepID=A0A8J4WC95_9STRA|nr:hypothetical protein G195_000116 [Phytophthora kernoviae 00238/432]
MNGFLMRLGVILEPIQWLSNEKYVLAIVIIVQLWLSLGTSFLAFIAGLQTIDRSLVEAGTVDGIKNRWQELWYITLPSMRPQLMFGAVMQITASFAVAEISIALAGFPSVNYAAHTVVTHLMDFGTIRLMLFALLALFGSFMVLPLIYTVNNAFKPLDELFIFPPRFWVNNPTMENFSDLINLMGNSWVPLSRYIANTLLITLLGTAGHILLASAAAYPLAKYRFPGSNVLFTIVILSLMFSPHVTAIPNYMVMSWLGWINTHASIIVPSLAFSLGLFLMKQFMEQIPDALLEAAKIDGANEYRIFWSIVMPNVKPAWLTLMILQFPALWGTDGGSFIYSENLKTLHYALSQIIQGGIARAGVGAAVALLLMIVPITLFIISQSSVMQTMATSGMKE